MKSDLLPHAIDREFPELSEAVAKLKETDHHFARLLREHAEVDDRITKDEIGAKPMGDAELENLKKHRLHLKDEIYRLATAKR